MCPSAFSDKPPPSAPRNGNALPAGLGVSHFHAVFFQHVAAQRLLRGGGELREEPLVGRRLGDQGEPEQVVLGPRDRPGTPSRPANPAAADAGAALHTDPRPDRADRQHPPRHPHLSPGGVRHRVSGVCVFLCVIFFISFSSFVSIGSWKVCCSSDYLVFISSASSAEKKDLVRGILAIQFSRTIFLPFCVLFFILAYLVIFSLPYLCLLLTFAAIIYAYLQFYSVLFSLLLSFVLTLSHLIPLCPFLHLFSLLLHLYFQYNPLLIRIGVSFAASFK